MVATIGLWFKCPTMCASMSISPIGPPNAFAFFTVRLTLDTVTRSTTDTCGGRGVNGAVLARKSKLRFAHDTAPFLDVALDHAVENFRRSADSFHAVVGEPLFHLCRLHNLVHRFVPAPYHIRR